MNSTELFLKAVDAYKAWDDSGKDFVSHSELWEAWDEAVVAFTHAAGMNRMEAIYAIRKSLGMRSF
jgi:hypothetical protein